MWGTNSSLQVGPMLPIYPQRIDGASNWSKVSTGTSHTMAIKTDGTLWSWGYNLTGGLGIGNVTRMSSPIQVGTLAVWQDVGTGTEDTIALQTNGTMWSWGLNVGGMLGQGDIINRSSPVQIGTLNVWSKISVGCLHTLALRTDGTLWSWGFNDSGQLGDGTVVNRSSPVQVGTLNTWSIISAGGDTGAGFSHAIRTDGTLWAWGRNTGISAGALGDNTVVNRSSPVQIGTNTNWANIGGGAGHAVAVTTGGQLWAWGLNSSGQVGDSTAINRSSPVQIGTLTNWGSSVLKVGGSNTMAIKTDGTLWSWGTNNSGVIGNPISVALGTTSISSPVQIGSGITWTHFSSSKQNTESAFAGAIGGGELYMWGGNNSSKLGFNNIVVSSTVAVSSPMYFRNSSDWSYIPKAGLRTFGIAIKTNGTLWVWGANAQGQLGDNTVVNKSIMVQVGTDTNWSKVEASPTNSTFGIKTDGSLWSWGFGTSGQLGLYANAPSWTIDRGMWSGISMGGNSYTMAIKTNGTLWGWGFNISGQMGIGSVVSNSSPVQIGTLASWSKVSAGNLHTMAIRTDGTLWGWGSNASGQIGDNTVISRSSPVQVGTLAVWSDVKAAGSISIGLRTNGTLWAWGRNNVGQVGDNTTTDRSSPVQIGTLTTWQSIASNGSGGYVIQTNGTLWSWGGNGNGQLGQGNTVSRSSPVQVGTLSVWSRLPETSTAGGAGQFYMFAIQTNGTLWAWGANSVGQLGDGSIVERSSPVQIGTLSTWSKVEIGASNTIAIKTDGSAWGWGLNTAGAVGDSSFINRSSPVQIGGYYNWSIITAGGNSSGGVKTDGTLRAWGLDSTGQLGRGFVEGLVSRSSPVQIGEDQWSDVFPGMDSILAIKTNGTLWSWGINALGNTGQSDIISRSAPSQIGSNTNWVTAASGFSHTMAFNSTTVV